MPSRSRMAALAALAVGLAAASALHAADDPAVANTVRLQLQITGLSAKGCTLKVAPAHPGCAFTPIERRIDSGNVSGMIRLREPIVLVATTTSADRDCSFAITIHEPGQSPQTFRRGIRLIPPSNGKPAPTQTVKVYLSTTPLAVRNDPAKAKR